MSAIDAKYSDSSLYFIKENVTLNEYNLHKYISDLRIVNIPKLYEYNRDTKVMVMERLGGMSISDMYGSEESAVDSEFFDKMRQIIQLLFDHGIEYPDITGYNFIEFDDKLWVIDFGDANFLSEQRSPDPFVLEFLQGQNIWNPNFL